MKRGTFRDEGKLLEIKTLMGDEIEEISKKMEIVTPPTK